jgi:phosphate-selective porin
MRNGTSVAVVLAALGLGAGVPNRMCAQQFPPPLREGTDRFRWAGYVQFRYTSIENEEDLFGLRRFKLMAGGNLGPRLQWYVQGLFKDGNASPTDGRGYFQEAWIRYAWRKGIQVVAGQFKPPFGRERFTPDFEIATIDRSLVTDALTPDGPYVDSFYRDRGVQIDGEPHKRIRYAIGAFDGRGAHHQFHGVGPMVVGQAILRVVQQQQVAHQPVSLQLGGAYAARRGSDLPFRSCCPTLERELSHFRGSDRRWQLEVAADWGSLSVRAEYLRAILHFAEQPALGFAASGYYVLGTKYLAPKWQVVIKHETLDPNTRVSNAKDARQTTAGINYYIRQNRIKAMAGYVHREERIAQVANDLVQFQLQYFIH